MNEKSVSIGSDHGGFGDKEIIKKHLTDIGYEVIDCGTNSTNSCNYADYAIKAGELVRDKKVRYGIVVCTSGQGVCIASNKVKGVRCGIGFNDEVTRLLRQHNNANMISFSQKFMEIDDILRRVDIFLNTDFEGGRHQTRIDTISKYEK